MENLNAEQVKRDMEHCINDDCDKCSIPFGNCQSNLITLALALINSQEQRIKELTEHIHNLEQSRDYWKAKAEKLAKKLRVKEKETMEGG